MVRSLALPFHLPDALAAAEPPEKRGLLRDGVRLMVVDRDSGATQHARFSALPDFLRRGDCLVLNASRTLPAAFAARLARGRAGARGLELRLAQKLDDGAWLALILGPDQEPLCDDLRGETLVLGRDLRAQVLERDPAIARLWKIRFQAAGPELWDALFRLGRPIRYWYAAQPWDLDYFQTVYAREPGSVEMPSAGRAFTWRLLLDLKRRGVELAFLVLHTGLSSYMDKDFDATHPASEEPFRIDAAAAERINAAKAAGNRIVAVGTTVVRALESAAGPEGVRPLAGKTRLHITPGHALRVTDGLLTGFHEPEASHLDMLRAFLPEARLLAAYREALRERYLWHEFGDANLIL